MEPTPALLSDAELDALYAAAGLVIPEDLKPGVYREAKDLKAMTALLRGPRPATVEPSNVFSLVAKKK